MKLIAFLTCLAYAYSVRYTCDRIICRELTGNFIIESKRVFFNDVINSKLLHLEMCNNECDEIVYRCSLFINVRCRYNITFQTECTTAPSEGDKLWTSIKNFLNS